MNLFDSYIEAGQELGRKDRMAYYTAVIEFVAYGREPDLTGAAKAVFVAIRPSLESSRRCAENGKKGGRPKKETQTAENGKPRTRKTENPDGENTETQTAENGKPRTRKTENPDGENTETQTAENGKTNSNSKGNSKETPSNEGVKKAAKFTPPASPQEVTEYSKSIGKPIDGEEFFAYYASQDWKKANGQKLTSWKAAVPGWYARDFKRAGGRKEVPHAVDTSGFAHSF